MPPNIMEEKDKTIKFPQKEKLPLPDLSREIVACMSLPRLTFTDNTFSLAGGINRLNLSILRGQGAFWEMGLDRLLRQSAKYDVKYILTIDYDTVFTEFHILDLYEIMEANPEIDALFPLQIRRNDKVPIFESFRHEISTDGEKSELEFTDEELSSDFIEVGTGHFGLTLIRTKNLHKLKKPWLKSVPSTANDWGAGKIAADLYFWKNMNSAGLKVCLAPHVFIGHLELVCTWPGPIEKGWQATYMRSAESLSGTCPRWALPKSIEKYEYLGIS